MHDRQNCDTPYRYWEKQRCLHAIQENEEVIDITSTETIQASLECVSSLSGKELYVLEKMSEGHSIKEISEKMALTLNRIGQIARHGGAEIRKKMQIRYQRDIYLGKETQTFSCSIFSGLEIVKDELGAYFAPGNTQLHYTSKHC